MNKTLKLIIGILNGLMLAIAVKWYIENYEPEPLIAILSQIGSIIILTFERSLSKIVTKRVEKSQVSVDVHEGTKVKTSDIKDSKIDIKTK